MKAVNDGVGRTAQKQRREQGQTCRHRQTDWLLTGHRVQSPERQGGYSEAARQAIDKALKDNGYIRRVSLSRKQRTIEVVFRDFETIWALEVLRGIITEAKPHNINVMVAESGDRQHPDFLG